PIFSDTSEVINVINIPGAIGSGTKTVVIPGGPTPWAGISINLGDKADRLLLNSTFDSVSVNTGTDNDVVDVGGPQGAGSLDNIGGPVTVTGGGGIDTLRINDVAGSIGRSYDVTATQVTEMGGFSVTYAGIANLTVNAGSAALTPYTSDFFKV